MIHAESTSMISEGIVTTVSSQGQINIAPMGPEVPDVPDRLILKPFRSSTTYQNLKAHGEGVFHVTDDVLLLAQAAVGPVEPPPQLIAASCIRGWVLANSCRYHEFRVIDLDDRAERTRIDVALVHAGRL